MAGMQISGIASGMDTDSIIKDLMKAQQSKIARTSKLKIKLEMKQEVWKEMNTKLYSFYTKQIFDLKSSGSYKTKSATVSDESKLGVSASTSSVAGVHTVKVTQLAKGAHLYSNAISDDTVFTGEAMTFDLSDGKKTETIELAAGAKIGDLMAAINSKGLNIKASYDSTNKRIFMNSTTLGETSDIKFTNVGSTLGPILEPTLESEFFKKLGFNVNESGEINVSEANFYKDAGGAVATLTEYNAMDPATQDLYTQFAELGGVGQNSIYEYDGIEFKSDSNTVSVNGLSLTLKAESANITINITNNTDAVYNKIKDFIKAYNTLLEDMNTRVGADSNKYEPLTDEEKESLDDKTVEKWETKIKDALLRRDDKLTSISGFMRNIVSSSGGVNTSELTKGFRFLSDLGIVTGGYTEKGLLHIEGDADDSIYGLKENKLKSAIEENPEKVEALFLAIGNELYSTMSDKMKSSTLNSAFSLYNDKQMKKQVTEYERKISDFESRMIAMESRFRAQFTAMEKVIQKANSQSSSLMGMLGQ